MLKHKTWIICTVLAFFAVCFGFAAVTVYIDPFFHYHKPLSNYEYPLYDERYQNDGIGKHFEYDSIITGSSMTENFMKTQADELFDADFIKIPFNGGSYKEINNNLRRAYDTGKDIRYVIRCLDDNRLARSKNDEPGIVKSLTYLYNTNLFDDLNYVLNKTIFIEHTLKTINYTKAGEKTTTFDEYMNWNNDTEYGAQVVLSKYKLGPNASVMQEFTDEDAKKVKENIQQNVTDLASEHPETQFYIFLSPYSICHWDELNNNGQVYWRIEVEKTAIETLLECPNIKLYSFSNNFELTCNLDNYTDQNHYGGWINSYILQCMKNDEYLLTKDNYIEYIEALKDFYGTYDYASLR